MKHVKTLLFGCALLASSTLFAQNEDSEKNMDEHNRRSELFDSLKLGQFPNNTVGAEYQPSRKLNGKKVTEKWTYYDMGNETFELVITYRQGTTEYYEVYQVFKGELLNSYISEDEYYDGFDEQLSVGWSYECFWLGDEMIWMSSNGHGRTELDDWDAELEVKQWYAKRLELLEVMLLEHE